MKPFDRLWAHQPPGDRQPDDSPLSRRMTSIVSTLPPSVDARVQQLVASGSVVISLHTAEPSRPPPDHVVEAALDASRSERFNRHAPSAGLPELREAIAAKTTRDSGLLVTPAEVVVTSGTRQSVSNALNAVVDIGDEVLLPAPYWPAYRAAIELAGGHTVALPTAIADGFKVNVDQLQSALSRRTKALLFCSPCNPTGAVYTPAELQLIGEWAEREGLCVITDETYEHFVYRNTAPKSLPAVVPAIRDRCFILNGVAKAYAMPGWHVGWLIVPPEVAEAVTTLQSHVTSPPSSVAQAAALAALESGLAPIEALKEDLDRRRKRLWKSLDAQPGVEIMEPGGGLHVFPSVEAYLGGRLAGRQINTSLELAAALLDVAGVVVAPGEAFGRLGHLRVSFALSDDDLDEGIARLEAGLREVTENRR